MTLTEAEISDTQLIRSDNEDSDDDTRAPARLDRAHLFVMNQADFLEIENVENEIAQFVDPEGDYIVDHMFTHVPTLEGDNAQLTFRLRYLYRHNGQQESHYVGFRTLKQEAFAVKPDTFVAAVGYYDAISFTSQELIVDNEIFKFCNERWANWPEVTWSCYLAMITLKVIKDDDDKMLLVKNGDEIILHETLSELYTKQLEFVVNNDSIEKQLTFEIC